MFKNIKIMLPSVILSKFDILFLLQEASIEIEESQLSNIPYNVVQRLQRFPDTEGGDSLRRFLVVHRLVLFTGDGSRTRTGSGQRAKWLDQFYFKFIKSASTPWTRVISSDFQTVHTD